MNKKQAGIIVTLLVLIAVCGVLATKLNAPLYGLDGNPISKEDFAGTEEAAVIMGDASFEEAVIKRDTVATQTMEYLKDLINNESVNEEQRKDASEDFRKYALQLEAAKNIETKLKAQGYEDALCFVEDNSVTVYVKAKETLTEDQCAEIRSLVASESDMKEIEIGQKKN